MSHKKYEQAINKKTEFDAIMKEKDELEEEVNALREYYLKTKEINNKDESAYLQVSKNNEILNETTNILESAHKVLTNKPSESIDHIIRQEEPKFILSKTAEVELERHCTFIKKTMREIYSPTTNELFQVFGSADCINEILANKDYESLLVMILKVVSNMIVNEHSEAKDIKGKYNVDTKYKDNFSEENYKRLINDIDRCVDNKERDYGKEYRKLNEKIGLDDDKGNSKSLNRPDIYQTQVLNNKSEANKMLDEKNNYQ